MSSVWEHACSETSLLMNSFICSCYKGMLCTILPLKWFKFLSYTRFSNLSSIFFFSDSFCVCNFCIPFKGWNEKTIRSFRSARRSAAVVRIYHTCFWDLEWEVPSSIPSWGKSFCRDLGTLNTWAEFTWHHLYWHMPCACQ